MVAPRYRILMVDDVIRYHHLYEMAITDALPCLVHFAVNGVEALEKLAAAQPYDLLILDLNMPKLGGEATLARIRQDPNFDTMPVIVLTGSTDQEIQHRLLDLGADDFVEKGAKPEIFVARLKTQIRHKSVLARLSQLAVDMDIFAAGVLHDIRNLETTIMAVADLSRAYLEVDLQQNREQMLEDFTQLEARADSLGAYAADILRMVRMAHKPLKIEPQDLLPLLQWVEQVASPRQGEDALTLRCHAEGTLIPVLADAHFLRLACLNIVQNAVKYRRPEETLIDVVVSQQESRPGSIGTLVTTRFTDNGRGIPQQELRKVFEPFVRGTSSGKQGGGFGLGLALVQKVIASMGGRVWAESAGPGKGASMCIELPIATSKSAREPA